jgi:hypothetical protein
MRLQHVAWCVAVLAVAILAPRSEAHTRNTDVTWLKDIQPIVRTRCTVCHSGGGSAQMSLVTYQEARTKTREIREEVLEGRMPPWPAARGIGDFSNDRSLTSLEIELLTAWADGNAPLGKTDAPSAPVAAPPSMAAPRTISVPPGRPIRVEERFELATSITSSGWITGWAFRPGDPAQVQRAIVSIADGDVIGSWTPGDLPTHFPSGVAERLPPNARIVVDIQYRKTTIAAMPSSSVDLYLGPAPRAGLHHQTLRCGLNDVVQRIDALAVTPSTIGAGESVEVIAHDADRSVKPLVAILQFDPSNQLTYRLRTPVQLAGGASIELRSSAANCGATLEFINSRSVHASGPQP